MIRHYGLKVGDHVTMPNFSGISTVVELSALDNNRVFVLDNYVGMLADVIAEYCTVIKREEMTAQQLFDAGYRPVSNKYRTVSRVDVSTKTMIDMFIKQNFGNNKSGVAGSSIDHQKEHYRRCHSKDEFSIPKEHYQVWKELKKIAWDFNETLYSRGFRT